MKEVFVFDESNLIDCPFCGGHAKIKYEKGRCLGHGMFFNYAWIECQECHAKSDEVCTYGIGERPLEDLVKLWNRRV